MHIARALVISALLGFLSLRAGAQVAGDHSFTFLKMADNSRTAALGGENISVGSRDVNMFYHNPALLSKQSNRKLGLNYNPFYAGINGGNVAYAHTFDKAGTWGANVRYIDYGTMEETTPTGRTTGEFSAADYQVHISHSRTKAPFRLGASLQFAGSRIAGASAHSLGLNLGGLYTHPDSNLTAAISMRNIGFALNTYHQNSKLSMPLNILIGLSYKPEHMPFRFSFTGRNLNSPQIGTKYQARDPNSIFSRKVRKDERSTFNRISGHFVLGGELLISENFHIRTGYNFLRRQQLRLAQKSGGAGMSFGAMVRIQSFEFSFTRAYYHISGGTSFFSITTDLNTLTFKKVEKK